MERETNLIWRNCDCREWLQNEILLFLATLEIQNTNEVCSVVIWIRMQYHNLSLSNNLFMRKAFRGAEIPPIREKEHHHCHHHRKLNISGTGGGGDGVIWCFIASAGQVLVMGEVFVRGIEVIEETRTWLFISPPTSSKRHQRLCQKKKMQREDYKYFIAKVFHSAWRTIYFLDISSFEKWAKGLCETI